MIGFFWSETWEKTYEMSESVKDFVLHICNIHFLFAKSVANKMDYGCCHFTSFKSPVEKVNFTLFGCSAANYHSVSQSEHLRLLQFKSAQIVLKRWSSSL